MKKFIEQLEAKNYNFVLENGGIIVNHNLDVWLNSLEILPENVKFENKGDVSLNSLKTLPENMFRNPKTERIIKINSDGMYYAGCFAGDFEALKKICLEKNFMEVLEWAEKLK